MTNGLLRYIIIGCCCTLPGTGIRFVHIKNANARHYRLEKKAKQVYDQLPKPVYAALPDSLDYYSFRIDDAKKTEIASCVGYINELKEEFDEECRKKGAEYTDATFAAFWKTRRQACYIMLKDLYPVLVFEFDNPGKASYKLRSIKIRNYTKTQKLGTGNPWLDNSGFGRESLVIDTRRGDSTYLLMKTQDLGDQSVYQLALTLLTTDYRSDDPPVRLLLDITFNFEDKQGRASLIRTAPFMIDL